MSTCADALCKEDRWFLFHGYRKATLTNVALPWHTRPRGGGAAITFYEVFEQVIALLQRHGRVTYRALMRHFDLDDDYLEDLKAELIDARQLAVDEGAVTI